MKDNNREQSVASERRNEVRLDGKQVEGIHVFLIDSAPTAGWDQNQRFDCAVSNLSAGGIEVQMPKNALRVDQMMMVSVRFPKLDEEMQIPAMIRHIHHVSEGLLVGMQFLWSHKLFHNLDLEYRFCDQLLWCERRGV